MHTQPLNAPNGHLIAVVGLVSYNDLRAMTVSLRMIAMISRDSSIELFDYEPTDVRPDVGDGVVIKPNSIDDAEPGRWVRKPMFGSAGGAGVSDHGALTGLGDDDHPQYMTEPETETLIDSKVSAARSIMICLTD